MKILFVVESYFPRTSGVPVVVKYLAEGLSNKGHDVSVVTTSIPGIPQQEKINNVNVYRFNLGKTLLKKYVGDIIEYRNFVVDFKADVTIFECTECVTTDVLLKVLDKIKGKKILHSHGFFGMKMQMLKWNVNLKYTLGNTYNFIRLKLYYAFYLKRYITWFDRCLCLSEVDSSRAWLEKYSNDVKILQNAVDDAFLNPTKTVDISPFCSMTLPYAVSVATYSKIKNQVGILREYFKSDANFALVFIGPTENEYFQTIKKELTQLEHTYGKKEVYLLLSIPREYIPDIIGNAFVYLTGSACEEYSISLIEAMSKGVPFISTNVGNARILPGGLTINKMGEMHECIDKLMRDKNLYENLSRLGKNFVAENCKRVNAVNLLENYIL